MLKKDIKTINNHNNTNIQFQQVPISIFLY